MEQGPTELTIIKQALRTGMPLPKAIENAPELWPGLELYLNAWFELDTTRSIGMNVGPIPWNAIESYCLVCELDVEQKAKMHKLVRALDRVYLDHQRKK